jgi:hypothetical protein
VSIVAITLDELEADDNRKSVWILNSAADSRLQMEGELLINIPNAQGRAELMRVPQTWLPFNATGRFTKKRLLESTEFRNAVVEELITLIDEPTASKIMKSTGAREEQMRMQKLTQQIKDAGAVRKISDANVDVVNSRELSSREGNAPSVDIHSETTAAVKAGVTTGQAGLSANFEAFFQRLKTQPDVNTLGLVRGKSKLSRRELRYLRDNLPSHPQTVKLIRSRLVELKKAAQAAEQA